MTNHRYASEAVSNRENTIPYDKRWREFTGSVTAALLLQQMTYRTGGDFEKPFYKFKEYCSHALYRPGDSWTEEMGYSRKEFEGALKKIATGVKSKSEALQLKKTGKQSSDLVYYWTDASRLTWYLVNADLLELFLTGCYEKNLKHKRDSRFLESQNLESKRDSTQKHLLDSTQKHLLDSPLLQRIPKTTIENFFLEENFSFSDIPISLSEIKTGYIYLRFNVDKKQLVRYPISGNPTKKGIRFIHDDPRTIVGKLFKVEDNRYTMFYQNGDDQLHEVVLGESVPVGKLSPEAKEIRERLFELVGPSELATPEESKKIGAEITEASKNFVERGLTMAQLEHYQRWFDETDKANYGGKRTLKYLRANWRDSQEWQGKNGNGQSNGASQADIDRYKAVNGPKMEHLKKQGIFR